MYVSRVKFSIGIIRPPGKNVQSTALGIHALWRHLALLGLAKCKPGLVHWACSGRAQKALDGARGRVYPKPKAQQGAFGLTPSISNLRVTQTPRCVPACWWLDREWLPSLRWREGEREAHHCNFPVSPSPSLFFRSLTVQTPNPPSTAIMPPTARLTSV